MLIWNNNMENIQNSDTTPSSLQTAQQNSSSLNQSDPNNESLLSNQTTSGLLRKQSRYSERSKIISIVSLIIIILIILGLGIYFIQKPSKKNNDVNTKKQLSENSYNNLSTQPDVIIDSEASYYEMNVYEGENPGFYRLSFNTQPNWGYKMENDEKGCETYTYSRGPINLGIIMVTVNCGIEESLISKQQDDISIKEFNDSQIITRNIYRSVSASNNLYKYLGANNNNPEQLSNIIKLGPFNISVSFDPNKTNNFEEAIGVADNFVKSLKLNYMGGTFSENAGHIEGDILITYNNSLYPEIKEDINLTISEKREGEANYFGIPICPTEANNCIWLVSEKNNTRLYKYRQIIDGGLDNIRIGEKYKTNLSIRFYTDSSNIDVKEQQGNVLIPPSGVAIKNYTLIVE